DEAQDVAQDLVSMNPDLYYYADQYNNESNQQAHYESTGPEIVRQTNHRVTHFIAGLGTTGTFTGTSRFLKNFDSSIKLIGLQPDLPMHGLEGWKHLETAHMPGIYDDSLADEIRSIHTEEAYQNIKKAALQEGLLLSPSSAANLTGALQLAAELDEGVIVTVFPDDGSRYREVIRHIFNT
ncbi:MAG: pyridoxal-phosphate dependent enzyme, partial [Balneolaceae bacterium]